jgi:hypothetical protein
MRTPAIEAAKDKLVEAAWNLKSETVSLTRTREFDDAMNALIEAVKAEMRRIRDAQDRAEWASEERRWSRD